MHSILEYSKGVQRKHVTAATQLDGEKGDAICFSFEQEQGLINPFTFFLSHITSLYESTT